MGTSIEWTRNADGSQGEHRSPSTIGMMPTGNHGPMPDRPRDGDKRQARRRINVEVREGRRPHPNALPCVDCGHIWTSGQRRHEYDHHLGYAPEHHYNVEAVCTKCHHARSNTRGESSHTGCPANVVFLVPMPGDKNPAAKLTWPVVRSIRARCAAGETHRSVSQALGMSETQIGNIVRGKCWKEVV